MSVIKIDHKIKSIIIALILTIVILIMLATNLMKKTDSLQSPLNIEHFTLDNGLEVLLIPNHRVPAVMHMLWYKVGGIDEIKNKTGLAHYLEHLMFHGTKKYPKDEIDKKVSSFGGSHNAFTSYDFTAYYQNIPKSHLEEVMDMESDRMRNLILNKKDAITERKIVLEERLLRRDNSPRAVLEEKVREALFSKNHPYGRPLIGYEADIETLTLDDAVEFYNKYYHPNNAILVIAGDISRQELEPLVNKYYAPLKSGNKINITLAKSREKAAKTEVKHYDKNTSNISLKLAYLAPDLMSENKEHSYSLLLISYLLAGGQNSILHKKLVLKHNLAINVSSYYSQMSRGQSYFTINATLKDENYIERVIAAIEQEITNLKNNKINKKDLEIAKNLFLIETIYSKESYKSLAYIIGMNYTTGIDLQEIIDWDKNIDKVTVDDIKAAANYSFQPEKFTIGYLIPDNLKK